MAYDEVTIDVAPERIFEVLADGWSYAGWVVGAKRIRGVDKQWPQPGAKFYHEVGTGPFVARDSTRMLEWDPPRRAVLEARIRPFGVVARIVLDVEARAGGSLVRMREEPLAEPTKLMWNPVVDKLTSARNRRSLRRLRELALRAEGPRARTA